MVFRRMQEILVSHWAAYNYSSNHSKNISGGIHPQNAIILASFVGFLIASFKKGNDKGELKKNTVSDLAFSCDFDPCTLDI